MSINDRPITYEYVTLSRHLYSNKYQNIVVYPSNVRNIRDFIGVLYAC